MCPQRKQLTTFISKKLYTLKILNEIGSKCTPSPRNEFSSKEKDEIMHENSSFSDKFGLNSDKKDKSFPTMYWGPKMHKDPIGACFLVAQKKCNKKFISKAVSEVFKLNFHQIQSL